MKSRKDNQHQSPAADAAHLDVAARSVADGLIGTDAQGAVVFLNPAGEALTGWSARQAAGRPVEDVFCIVDEETGRPCQSPVESVLSTGEAVESPANAVLVTRGGSELVLSYNASPVRDREGRIAGAVLAFRDVTDRVQLEDELRRAQRMDSIGILAGGIAHDFNNMLTAILGNITLAQMFSKSGQSVEDCLQQAEKACWRAEELTQQLLTFVKGGAPVRKLASLAALIRETGDFALRGSNVRCEFGVSPDLWPAEVDEGQISQVINNLMINADQAMPDGGTIQVSAENAAIGPDDRSGLPEGKYLKISVQDHGVGIPPERIEKVFEPYFTTRPEGRGLGLSTARTIVKRHRGLITVDSQVGAGTTFTVYLPASEGTPQAAPRRTNSALKGTGRVLLMDDEDMVLKTAGPMLEHLGYEVTSARDGHEAIKLYRKASRSRRPFDAVVLDLTVPGVMGGQECIRELLAIDPRVKALASSGYSGDAVEGTYRQEGFSGFVTKPYSLEKLGQALHRLIGGG